jgi:hypothetical protein
MKVDAKIEVKLVEGQVLRLQPGDVLWVEFDKSMHAEDVLGALDRVRAQVPDGVRVIAAQGCRPVAPPKDADRDFGDFDPDSLGAGRDEPGV